MLRAAEKPPSRLSCPEDWVILPPGDPREAVGMRVLCRSCLPWLPALPILPCSGLICIDKLTGPHKLGGVSLG